MESIENRGSDLNSEDDSCAICLGHFQDPRILPCSHSFCRSCLQQHITRTYSLLLDSFQCPLCRRLTSPISRQSSIDQWATFYPINFFLNAKCGHHRHRRPSSAIAICFNHNQKICLVCFIKLHRSCCLSIDPTKKSEILAYFHETYNKAIVWRNRLENLKKSDQKVCFLSINEVLSFLQIYKSSIFLDVDDINRQTPEVITILRFQSDDFRILENDFTRELKPEAVHEFKVKKLFLSTSTNVLVKQNLLSDNNVVIGLTNKAKLFVMNLEGKCFCEFGLLGPLIALHVFGESIFVLLKSSMALDINCLQNLRYFGKQLIPFSFHVLQRNYCQFVALSNEKLVGLYNEQQQPQWRVDIIQLENPQIVTSVPCSLESNSSVKMFPFNSYQILFVSGTTIFQLNLENENLVCLWPESHSQRNRIDKISHLAVVQSSSIYFADSINASVYKLSLRDNNQNLLTLFLNEKMNTEQIIGCYFNSSGHILICFEFNDDYVYRLYEAKGFPGWEDEKEESENFIF